MPEHTTRERLEAVERLRREAASAGTPEAAERQRARGKLLARERIELLLDPGSFTELDAFVQHRNPNFNMMENRPYGDGVVTGTARSRAGGCSCSRRTSPCSAARSARRSPRRSSR